MPQMFPLLWFVLFIMTASALFSMISSTHFSLNKTFKMENMKPFFVKDHAWKW